MLRILKGAAAIKLGASMLGCLPEKRVRTGTLLEKLEERSRLKLGRRFAENFERNEPALYNLLRQKRPEIIRVVRESPGEKGGVFYLSNGRVQMEWVEDKDDKRFFRAADGLKSCDLRKVPLADYDFVLDGLEQAISFNREIAIKETIEAARRMRQIRERIASAQAGKTSPMPSKEEAELMQAFSSAFREMAGMQYGSAAKERAYELNKNPNNQILATFHTHPDGREPAPSDVSNTLDFPDIVFSLQRDRLKVYYLVNQRCTADFSLQRYVGE
jgi:hypothetical protein